MRQRTKTFLAVLLFSLLPIYAKGQDFTGKVVAVKDGDTIEISKSGKKVYERKRPRR